MKSRSVNKPLWIAPIKRPCGDWNFCHLMNVYPRQSCFYTWILKLPMSFLKTRTKHVIHHVFQCFARSNGRQALLEILPYLVSVMIVETCGIKRSKRVSSAFPLPAKFNGNLSGTCVSVAVGEHLLEYLTSMSVQDVEKEVRCRWKLIQLVNHREKDKGRVEVGCDSHAKGRFSFLNNRRS